MTSNVGSVDRFIRIVVGLAFVAFSVKDDAFGAQNVVVGVIGVILLATAFFSYCPLYTLVGFSSFRRTDQTT